jgi:N-acetylmuramoyl-L-alanine amidase
MTTKTLPRNINYIVVHCSGNSGNISIADIKKRWKEKLKWTRPGYHYIIERDGNVVKFQDENEITNGVKGYNKDSVHVCYIGGIDKQKNPVDNRTRLQREAMFDLLVELSVKYPKAEIKGHRDFPNVIKACPSFDVKEWLKAYVPDLDLAA